VTHPAHLGGRASSPLQLATPEPGPANRSGSRSPARSARDRYDRDEGCTAPLRKQERTGTARLNGHRHDPGSLNTDRALGTVRVVIAHPHELCVDSLGHMIRTAPDLALCAAARTGFAALEEVRRHKPDVVLLDLAFDDLDGLSILNAIEREGLPARCVFLTRERDAGRAFEALSAGACGLLDLHATWDELCDAIREAAGEWVSGGISTRVQLTLVQAMSRAAARDTPRIDEGTREVLQLTADELSPNQIARELHLAPATVKGRLHAAYKQLGVKTATGAAVEALRRGIIH
jgi:two-component system, NarL family, nitrate/nitrite response regulator NarL